MHIQKFIIFFLLLFLGLKPEARAQLKQGFIEHYTENNGLSHGQVTQFLQDNKGYIWLSTWNGIEWYDGENFHCFKAQPGDGSTLKSNRIETIYDNSQGDLWGMSLGRIFHFSRSSEAFTDLFENFEKSIDRRINIRDVFCLSSGYTWMTDNESRIYKICDSTLCITPIIFKSNPPSRIYRIFEDKSLNTWLLTDKGSYLYDSKGWHFICSLPLQYVKERSKKLYLCDSNGNFRIVEKNGLGEWICYGFRLPSVKIYNMSWTAGANLIFTGKGETVRYDLKNKKITLYQFNDFKNSKIKKIHTDSSNNIWFVTEKNEIFRFDPSQRKITFRQAAYDSAICGTQIVNDRFDDIWLLGCDGQIRYFDKEANILRVFSKHEADDQEIFYSQKVLRLVTDGQHNLWLLKRRGVDKITPYRPAYDIQDRNLNIRTLYKDRQGNIWKGAQSGELIRETPDGGISYLNGQGKLQNRPTAFTQSIYAIFQDNENNMWIGCKTTGLFLLKPDKGNNSFAVSNFRHSQNDPFSISANEVYCINQDNCGNIWAGTFKNGVNRIDQSAGQIRFINHRNLMENYPQQAMFVRSVESSEGAIILGTTEGLITFAENISDFGTIRYYQNCRQPDSVSSISDNVIMNLFKSSNNQIFALTYNGGLNKIVSRPLLSDSIRFTLLGTKKGAVSESALAMQEDRKGNLWISYEGILSCFNTKDSLFENISYQNLNSSFIISEGNICWAKPGTLLIPSSKGTLSVNIDSIRPDQFTPHIAFTSLSSSDRAADEKDSISLESESRNLTIGFSAADYRIGSDIEYAVKMEDTDKRWTYIGNSNSFTYMNLQPGEYDFNVRSTNRSGRWTENTRKLHISVIPTFWETGYAKILYGVIAFLIFFLGQKLIRRSRRFMREYKIALEEARRKRLSASIIPAKPEIESSDDIFLRQMLTVVENHISDSEFSVDQLTSEMAMSRTAFNNKTKELLGQTPSDFIRETRIKRAMQLLDTGEVSVAEAAYSVGFSDPKFFSRTFKKLTGLTPKEFRNREKDE